MTEFLTRQNHTGRPEQHMHDPYTVSGARSILRRFRDDVIAMLRHMEAEEARWAQKRVFLAKSPLRKKIYVAAAMKTLGLIEELPTSESGACVLRRTEKAIQQMEQMEKYL